jgi:hypothetical protein
MNLAFRTVIALERRGRPNGQTSLTDRNKVDGAGRKPKFDKSHFQQFCPFQQMLKTGRLVKRLTFSPEMALSTNAENRRYNENGARRRRGP